MFLDTAFLKTDEIFLRLDKTSEGNPARNWVPAYYFTIMNHSGEELGSCDLRIGHNEQTYFGGNIGYAVHEQHRGHHYATKACLLLFELARRHGLGHLIITCNPDNTPSRRTCERLGGILLEIADLPEDTDMYARGERKKCIFRVNIKKRTDQ